MRILHDDIDRVAWSELVKNSATGTWFQTPEAYDFFASQSDIMEPFILGVRSAQGLRGVCAGYVTKERSAFKQFFTRRAIITGGPCLANDCTNKEVETLMFAIRKALTPKAIYIETRNLNDYSRWREAFEKAGFAYQRHLNFHVETTNVEMIESRLGKNRKRDIATTIREGVEVIEQPTEEQVRAFYRILDRLYRTRVKTPLFPESFFLALRSKNEARIILTSYRGQIIGGTACVMLPEKCVYEWFVCGEDGVYPHVFPSSYATYAGMRFAAQNGCGRFDMMGAGKPEDTYGVRQFKARFGGQEVEHGRFIYIVHPILYRIGATGVKMLKNQRR